MKNKAIVWIILAIIILIVIFVVFNNQSDSDGTGGGTGGAQETYQDFDAGGDNSVFNELDDVTGTLG